MDRYNPPGFRKPFTRADFERGRGDILSQGRWANAVLFMYPKDGELWVVKDFRPRSLLVRETIGRLLTRRELRGLRRVAGVQGVPAGVFRLDRHALAYRYVHGSSIWRPDEEKLPTEYYSELERLLKQVHARGVVHLDVRNARNILVDDEGHPLLLDFQSHLGTRWLPSRLRTLVEQFDLSGVYKHWAGNQPETLGEARAEVLDRMNRWRRFWVVRGYFGLPKAK
jgi:RIO-like serine/threonine protein kinase